MEKLSCLSCSPSRQLWNSLKRDPPVSFCMGKRVFWIARVSKEASLSCNKANQRRSCKLHPEGTKLKQHESKAVDSRQITELRFIDTSLGGWLLRQKSVSTNWACVTPHVSRHLNKTNHLMSWFSWVGDCLVSKNWALYNHCVCVCERESYPFQQGTQCILQQQACSSNWTTKEMVAINMWVRLCVVLWYLLCLNTLPVPNPSSPHQFW